MTELNLFFDRNGNPTDPASWSAYYDANYLNRSLGDETINGYRISTVWTGMNMMIPLPGIGGPFSCDVPLIFETMVFDSRGSAMWRDRYPTEDSARAGHEAVVRRVAEQGAFWEKLRREFDRLYDRLIRGIDATPSFRRAVLKLGRRPLPLRVNGHEYSRRRRSR